MNIVTVFSPNWAEYVAVEMYALFATNPPPIKVYLVTDLAGDLTNFKRVQAHFGDGYCFKDLYLKDVGKMVNNTNVDSRFTKYTLYRLVLPKVIDDNRILYIDADAIVNGDITDFYHMDLGANLIAGVIDQGAYDKKYSYLLDGIGFTRDDIYLNAGVMLFNWAKIRELNLCETWLKEINSNHYGCHDQDVINMTCRGRALPVNLKYNVSLSTGLKTKEIKIMHYAGIKPWQNPQKVPYPDIWRKWVKAAKKVMR